MIIQGNFRPMPDDILVCNLEKGMQKTKGGILLTDDNGKESGIRPRWCQIYRIGKNIDNDDLQVGKWILVDHGHWSTTFTIEEDNKEAVDVNIIIKKNIKEGILLSTDEKPIDIITI